VDDAFTLLCSCRVSVQQAEEARPHHFKHRPKFHTPRGKLDHQQPAGFYQISAALYGASGLPVPTSVNIVSWKAFERRRGHF